MEQPGEGVRWQCLLSKRCIAFTCLEIDPTNYSLLQLKVYVQGVHCSIVYNSKRRSRSRGLIKYIIRQPYRGIWAAILKGSGVVSKIYKVRWRMMHNILPLDLEKKRGRVWGSNRYINALLCIEFLPGLGGRFT